MQHEIYNQEKGRTFQEDTARGVLCFAPSCDSGRYPGKARADHALHLYPSPIAAMSCDCAGPAGV